jgi:DNA-binding PadR family transcriptional regulator
MNREQLKGHLDVLLLAAVEDAPAHGYAIAAALRSRSDGTFDLAEGTLYPALHRLEHGGQLRSSWADVAGRRRRVYAITAAGAKALARQRREWKQFASGMNTVLGSSA